MTHLFQEFAAAPSHPRWEALAGRKSRLYARPDDIRDPFARDYTRVLHSMAYRRLKHKTQVFFNIDNDHICTRMEHVAHVESVSSTIAAALGLNQDLTRAIAMAHDLGHAPFGHQGETVIRSLSQTHLGQTFWHEQNGLRFADRLELLEDNYKIFRNLDLTYAVRDGIISHCGEVDENGLTPRKDLIPLEDFRSPGQYQPATWEGCVVKISDKIAYIGRDIEDAASLGFLDQEARSKLVKMARINDQNALNTTVIIHNMIIDICKNSSPEAGICLSPPFFQQLKELKEFNYACIYKHPRLKPFEKYAELVLTQLFEALSERYDGHHTWEALENLRPAAPTLTASFRRWLARFCDPALAPEGEPRELALRCENEKLYGCLDTREIYLQAVLDYISGMTDRFAIKVFQELLTY